MKAIYSLHYRSYRFWINPRRNLVTYLTLPNFSPPNLPPNLFLVGQEADVMGQKEFPTPGRIVSPVIKPIAWYFADWTEWSQIMCPCSVLYNSTFSWPPVRAEPPVKVVTRGNIRTSYTDMPINLLRARGINSLCLPTDGRKLGARDIVLRFSHQRIKRTV